MNWMMESYAFEAVYGMDWVVYGMDETGCWIFGFENEGWEVKEK